VRTEREEVGGESENDDAEKKVEEMSVGDGVDCIAPALSLLVVLNDCHFVNDATASNAVRCLA